MWEWLKKKAYAVWEKIKDFFNRSETIFLARLEAVAGLVLTAATSIDWLALAQMNLNGAIAKMNLFILGMAMFVKGIVTELARRRNATDL